MRTTIPGLLALAGVVAAGCGSAGSDDAKRAANATLTPQGVVDRYYAATIDGDGAAACSLLTRAAIGDVEAYGMDCVSRLDALAEQDTPEDKARMRAMHPEAVVRGARAVARFHTLGGNPTRIVLVKEDGWQVTDSPELENIRISNG